MIGRTFSHYRIDAKLGEGGMGIVYRATDLNLNRSVAIKFLSSNFVDEQRRRRFQQEAQTASSLNHPHILTVFEAGTIDNQQYLVTEYIDGYTLREWARRTQPRVRQVIELLMGIADAAATAHQVGILHRDIKPENILVAKNGYAKLVDFGLAKVLDTPSEDALETRTISAGMTKPGMVVGTVAYMSPEQASGQPVDARSDIFSFGIVLYEVLSGKRPFMGVTDVDLMHAILRSPARPLRELRPDLAPELRLVVDKSLEKALEDRYQSMREVVVDLRRFARASISEEVTAATSSAAPLKRQWWIPVTLIALLAVGALLGRLLFSDRGSRWRNPLEGASFARLTDFEGVELDAVISPDGKFVAFISNRDGPLDVWILQLGTGQFLNLTKGKVPLASSQVRVIGFTPDGSQVTLMTNDPGSDGKPVSGTSAVATIGGPVRLLMVNRLDPQWSLDGTGLLYLSLIQNRDIMYMANADGSNPRELFPVAAGEHNHFMAISPSGRYAYSSRSTRNVQETDIWRAPAGGGRPERITHHDGWTAYPTPLDDRALLYIASDERNAGTWLYGMDLRTGEEHRLTAGTEQYTSIAATPPVAGRPRRLVATVSNPSGSLWSIPIGEAVMPESAATKFSVPSARVSSPSFGPGYLLYLSSRELADGLWKVQGEAATELWKASDGAILAAPAPSRDGRQIAIVAWKQQRASVHIMSADGANPQALATSLTVRETPTWSPDGKMLAVTGYDANGPGLFLLPIDGSAPRRLYDQICYLPVWSPDGRYILYAEYFQGPRMQVKAVTPEGKPFPLPAIQLTRTGVRSMSSAYRFLPDGKALVLLDGDLRKPAFWRVDLADGTRRQLTDLRAGSWIRSFDVTQDGKRILFDRVNENADLVLIELPARSQ